MARDERTATSESARSGLDGRGGAAGSARLSSAVWLAVLAVVAACVAAVVAGSLLVAYLAQGDDPYAEPNRLSKMRSDLKHATGDAQELTTGIRQYDVQLRQSFLRRRNLADSGRWLLAAALIVALVAARWHARLTRKLDHPPLDAGSEEPDWPVEARRSSRAVAVAAAVIGGLVLGGAIVGPGALPERLDLAASGPEGSTERPVVRSNWPAFRGTTMMGVVSRGQWPDDWDGKSGRNVLWKTPIPGQGNSSPIVWGTRVFLTSASRTERWVHCFDADDGRVVWSRKVKSPPDSAAIDAELEVMDMTGYAAPTPVTDGEHVWATFANADVVCFGMLGEQKWVVNLGKPVSAYGLATSLVLYENLLILQHDQGAEAEDGLSSLIALDKATGDIVYDKPRPVPNSWSTPVVIGPTEELPRAELITCGSPFVIAYDPRTGDELWRAGGLVGDVAPMPVFAGGLVFVVNTDSPVMAIRPGGSGDVTETRVEWSVEESAPDTVSPLATATHYLHVLSYGAATCHRATNGELLWEHDFSTRELGCSFVASPVLAGSLVYLPAQDGRTFLFELADEFKLVRTCSLGEQQFASFAFANERVYIRGKKNLYCIRKPASGGGP